MANYILKKKKRQIKVQHFNINLKILVKLMSMGKVFSPSNLGGMLFPQISREWSVICSYTYKRMKSMKNEEN